MHHPVTGEAAYPLSAPMVDALRDLRTVHPTPHFIPAATVARALVNRGFVELVQMSKIAPSLDLYQLTPAGLRALRVAESRSA